MGNHENRLAQSSSAYLRSAAHQPIDWYEFGEEAFARARELDRPILLDIGAVWCHWCHVIDRESYENDEIAQLVNENYVAVKVDRDQRPDIDSRYQNVVAQLTGHAGWPLTGFLTWDGRLIYGGTYFPPQVMKSLLQRIAGVYHEKKAEIFREGTLDDILPEGGAPMSGEAVAPAAESIPITEEFGQNIVLSALELFDGTHGGFGGAPKFPHFSALEFLIQQDFRHPRENLTRMITKTLDEMSLGGMYDQVAGGFHRYSVDRQWHVPHFEKMAYDNAEALKVYAQAYRLCESLNQDKPLYRETVEGILTWVDEWLCDWDNGGFYASQDADIDLNDDGDHFTWTIDEIREILSPQEMDLVLRYYDMTGEGDMHERPGRNVLRVRGELDDGQARTLAAAKDKMRRHRRENRPIPFIDKTLYTNWNGMMITGYIEAADLLDLPEARAFALKTLDHLLERFYRADAQDDLLLHADGIEGLLDDYAHFSMALLKGYQTSGEEKYREAAIRLVKHTFEHFEDRENGAFYDTRQRPNALGLLKYKRKPVEDSPSSSANGIMLQVLTALYHLTGDELYHGKARKLAEYFMGHRNFGLFVSAFAIGIDQLLHPPLKIELAAVDGAGADMAAAARRVFYPGRIIAWTSEGSGEARLCVGTHCLPPVTEAEKLQGAIPKLVRGR